MFKAIKNRPKTTAGSQTVQQDSFEPSHKKPEIRQELVDTVKKKVEHGFYASEAVLDDLSDSFAKALNSAR
jgi:anti-sigma28 factor (negative regulator of flagellin synthesis)